MTPEDIRQAFFTQIKDNWLTTDVAWPNFSYDPDSEVAWIKPWVTMGSTFLGESSDQGVGIRYGILGISIYMPVDKGTRTGNEYATTLEALLSMKDLSGIITNRPTTLEIGINTISELNFYRIDVSVDFTTFSGE